MIASFNSSWIPHHCPLLFAAQFEAMADELERRREECIQLRTLLSSRTHGIMQPLADDPYGGDTDMINEDGELQMAYKTQKDLNKWVVGLAGDGQVGVALGWCITDDNCIQISWQYCMIFICFFAVKLVLSLGVLRPGLMSLDIKVA